MSGELPLYQTLCQTIGAIITVVGLDIQESAKTRSLARAGPCDTGEQGPNASVMLRIATLSAGTELVISSPRENTMHDTPPIEKVKLINMAFDSFMTIATACDFTRNLEYRIVAITLCNELLEDELSEAELPWPDSAIAEEATRKSSSIAGNTRYEKMIHAILSACMVSIDAMG
ncbi:hypothetical protein NM688_g8875 [Phlebia brevispora]|uniref:Uncharacterized protein n=1 Tax=Phlebia brevispora TaxID=194682 RepID=A0ACC1RP12_9APHY|nr:hypothetical protein NM688_g8875 [Phlebia brevispora]